MKGGINSLNMDLCMAVAAEGQDVICVVDEADESSIRSAEARRVVVIPLRQNVRQVAVADALVDLVQREGFPAVSWWIGHDVITGETARRAAQVGGGRVAVLHHIHHLSNKLIEGVASEKVQELDVAQRGLLRGAHLVVAVGPSLRRSAEDLLRGDRGPEVVELIPGLAEIEPSALPHKFSTVILGRFEDSAAKTKQLDLSVAAFAQAARDPAGPLGAQPLLTVFGCTESKARRRLDALVEGYAKRRVDVQYLPFEVDRDKLLAEVARQSAVMMLSWYEAFGLVAWEAIAAGVPLVLSRATGAYQQLERMLGNEAERLVAAVNVKAEAEPSKVRLEDVENVAAALHRIAADPSGARERALELRRCLVAAGVTWRRAARALVDACHAIDASPTTIGRRDLQDFVCAEVRIAKSAGVCVALCLVVDSPEKTRTAVSTLASDIARRKGTPADVAARIAARGFDLFLDPPEVRRILADFALTAPVRAYAVVKRAGKETVPSDLMTGLLHARFRKRDLPLRSIRGATAMLAELKAATHAGWKLAGRPEPPPDVAVEPPEKGSLTALAAMMAEAVASAADGREHDVLTLLRIKFAHIYDVDSRSNYRADDAYP